MCEEVTWVKFNAMSESVSSSDACKLKSKSARAVNLYIYVCYMKKEEAYYTF